MSLTASKENPREQSRFPVVHLCTDYTAAGSSARQPAGHQTNCLRLNPGTLPLGFSSSTTRWQQGAQGAEGSFPALPSLLTPNYGRCSAQKAKGTPGCASVSLFSPSSGPSVPFIVQIKRQSDISFGVSFGQGKVISNPVLGHQVPSTPVLT